jgi:hypothetical protein
MTGETAMAISDSKDGAATENIMTTYSLDGEPRTYNEVMKKVVQYVEQKRKKDNSKEENLGELPLSLSLSSAPKNLSVAFLPDVSASNPQRQWFYRHLAKRGINRVDKNKDEDEDEDEQSVNFSIDFLSMPDVFELNTKRYEQSWLKYMRESLHLERYDCIVAHGTSSEAMMRFLESGPVPTTTTLPNRSDVKPVVLIDCNCIYTAGERHGRGFLFSRIIANHPSPNRIRFLTLENGLADDAKELRAKLGGVPDESKRNRMFDFDRQPWVHYLCGSFAKNQPCYPIALLVKAYIHFL